MSDTSEERLAAFVKRYSHRHLFHATWSTDGWRLTWRRCYQDCDSDWREVEADTLDLAISAAEALEAENDRNEPQHASREARKARTT